MNKKMHVVLRITGNRQQNHDNQTAIMLPTQTTTMVNKTG
jgi:hypothetical protein